jgi:hypothetical protein
MHDEAAALRRMIMGFRTTQLIYVAAKLGLADQMQRGPHAASALANVVGADARALYRLLRALSTLGVVFEPVEGWFELTPLGHWLCSDQPGSLKDLALLYGDEWYWQAYSLLHHSVVTGRPAFEQTHGQSLYAYLDEHPDAANVFNRAMSAFSAQEATALLAAYDFSAATTLIDVAGGQGNLLAAILAAHQQLCGVLFDLPSVIEGCRGQWANGELAARVQLVAGNFFEGLPSGGDAYLLKSILHNWNDAAAQRILQRCREAIPPHGRLLVVERVIPQGSEPAEAKLFDINMLVVLGGQERTADEYGALLAASGFALQRVISTRSPLSIIEAVPVCGL